MEALQSTLRYNRAPVIEASFEFGIDKMPVDVLPALEAVGRELVSTYPRKQYISSDRRISDEPPSEGELLGFAFVSEDGKQVVLSRRDGFSFHRLAPYDRWESFLDEARRTWEVYSPQVVPNGAVRRFAVRYINEFTLPFGEPLHHFFNVYPMTPNPEELFTDLFLRVQTQIEAPPGRLTTILAPVRRTQSDTQTHYHIILDNQLAFDINTSDSAWKVADQVRLIKNNAFDSQITERLKADIA
jgi:uncharacterized protein (TIGR04255 family)